MAFEASALDVEGIGKTVLGRFSDESLGFRICYSQSFIYCEEETLHFRVPLILPPRLPSRASPDHWQAFLRCCFGKFLERRGLEVFPRLSGGGNCISSSNPNSSGLRGGTDESSQAGVGLEVPITDKKDNPRLINSKPENKETPREDPIGYGPEKSWDYTKQQKLAREIAEEVVMNANKGVTLGMRLADLENLPQMTIRAPYIIAKRLLDALHEPKMWSLPGEYVVRATIARLARRYMMDHIFLKCVKFSKNTELNDALQEVLDKASQEDNNTWAESGLLAQCKALNILVTIASTTDQWWGTIPPAAKPLFESYRSYGPLMTIPDFSNTISKERSMVGTKFVIEFHLQVDNIYCALGNSDPTVIDCALRSLSELLQLGKSWKNLYTALTCLEWAIHKDKFTEAHITQLRPSLKELTTINSVKRFGLKGNHWRVCEKVATILIKLNQKNWLTDLLVYMMKNEADPRISRLFPEELYVEHRLLVFMNIRALSRFTGRESEMQQAKDLLKVSKVLRIVGPAGSGKTSLATSLALSLASNFEVVWKCNADSEANLSGSLERLATRLKLGDYFSELLYWLNSHQVLLLLDNLDFQLPETFQELLEGKISVIITSRNAVQTDCLRIRGLDPSVAVDLVIELTKRDNERRDIESVCRELSYLPLALKNVSALLNTHQGGTVAKATEWIRNIPAELDPVNSESSPRLMNLLEECVKKVTSETGKRLLFITADLSPDIIPEPLYKEIFAGDEGELQRAKSELQALSLIEEDEQHNLSVHCLIQQATRSCYPEQVLGLFPAKVQALLDLFDYEKRSELSITFSKSAECIAKLIQNKPLPEPEEVSLCIRFVYFCMKQLGTVEAVVEMHQKCCVWWEKRATVTDQSVSDLQCMAICCLNVPNSALAEKFMMQVIEFHLCGRDRLTLALSYFNLALAYQTQRKFVEAEEFYSKTQKIYEADLSNTHPKLAILYGNRAIVDTALGNFEKAEEYNLKALEIKIKILPPMHPSLATSYNNLAHVYHAQGKFEKAEEYNLKALKILEAVQYPMHPDLATSYGNLAVIYKAQGQFDIAEEYNLKAIQIYESVLSPTHPALATAYNNLANVYQAQGNLEETEGKLGKAEEYNLKAIKIYESVHSPTHPSLATSYGNLAVIYKVQGKLEKAEEYNLKALKIYESVLSPRHPSLATSYNNLANIYEALGNSKGAEKIYLKALQIRESVLHSSHPDLAGSYGNLALFYMKQGQLKSAEAFYLKALKIYEAILPFSYCELAELYNKLATIYMKQGKSEEGKRLSLKILALHKSK